jgi:hypothetical protein
MALLSAKLPAPVFQSLLAEAQLDDVANLDQDTARFTMDLLSRKQSKKPPKDDSKPESDATDFSATKLGPPPGATPEAGSAGAGAADATGAPPADKQGAPMTAGPQSPLISKP